MANLYERFKKQRRKSPEEHQREVKLGITKRRASYLKDVTKYTITGLPAATKKVGKTILTSGYRLGRKIRKRFNKKKYEQARRKHFNL